MAPLLQLLDKTGALLVDVSTYMRVADQDGLDPYPTYEDPGFNDAPLGEGAPLLSIDEKNREQAFPLWVKGTSKDNLHQVLATLGRACQNCARAAWQDDGASLVSYLDVTYARFDAAYKYFPARKAWFAGVLRVFCAPPFAHTATERIVATNVNSAGLSPVAVATIPAGSIVGDVSALLKARVDTSGVVPGPLGRVVGLAELPSGYVPFVPAASMFALAGRATLTGASGAPGSQVIAPATTGLASTAQIARFALSATPYAGANRLLGVVRPARVNGLALTAIDELGNVLGPTALAQGIDGMQLVDLGVANIGTQQATQTFGIGGGPPMQAPDDSQLQRLTGADRAWGQLAGVIVMPESALTLAIDPGARIAGRWYAATGAASTMLRNAIDDYGNPLNKTASANYLTPTGAVGDVVNKLPFLPADFRSRAIYAPHSSATINAALYLYDEAGNSPIQGFYNSPTGAAASPGGNLSMYIDGALAASLAIPSQAILQNQASGPLMLDLVRMGAAAFVNLRALNASGAGGISVRPAGGATTVPVACVGLATESVRALRAQYTQAAAFGVAGAHGIMGLWVDQLQGFAGASDTYTLDGANGISYRTPVAASSAVLPMSDKLRGALLKLDPQVAAVAVFDSHLDGGPMNDPLGVEIRVRERFRYAR